MKLWLISHFVILACNIESDSVAELVHLFERTSTLKEFNLERIKIINFIS